METILLNGSKGDPHIKGICNELEKIKQNYFITDKFSTNDIFSVDFRNGEYLSSIDLNSKKIDLSKIKSIWNTSPLHVNINNDLTDESKPFVKAEWTEGIHSLWNSIKTRWINHPDSILASVNRIKQLEDASKLGLDTPITMVTNSPEKLTEFYEEFEGEIIAKTLHSSEGLPEDKMIFTTKITKKDLERKDELRYAPCMFQEYIKKKTEFRVTIVGNTIRAAEIYSQMSSKTKHDWRQYDDFKITPYKEATLPSDISKKLLKLMKLMKLEFGAADLIRTPDDEYVFLEINPNGRWWWIQELTGMNIAKDIAQHLSSS